jgi:hypothetical protein
MAFERTILDAGSPEVWDALTRQFEAKLIVTRSAPRAGARAA